MLLCAVFYALQSAVATTADAKGMFPEHHEQYIGENYVVYYLYVLQPDIVADIYLLVSAQAADSR
jgi:thiamine pyrophosphate-dependent acetolactate synthase large subunit-like protein